MLYIVNKETDMILNRWDGWYIHAEDEAGAFIRENGLTVLKDEITLMGDRIVWVA